MSSPGNPTQWFAEWYPSVGIRRVQPPTLDLGRVPEGESPFYYPRDLSIRTLARETKFPEDFLDDFGTDIEAIPVTESPGQWFSIAVSAEPEHMQDLEDVRPAFKATRQSLPTLVQYMVAHAASRARDGITLDSTFGSTLLQNRWRRNGVIVADFNAGSGGVDLHTFTTLAGAAAWSRGRVGIRRVTVLTTR